MALYQNLPRDEHELSHSPGPARSDTLNPYDENELSSFAQNDSESVFNPYNDENINMVGVSLDALFFILTLFLALLSVPR